MPFLLILILAWFRLFLPATSNIQGSEICDNGIDDNGDDLIDLNDPECICHGIKDTFFIPSGLIPNPSFEDYNQCPDTTAQLARCKNWIQASLATSDYFNLCDFWKDDVRGTPPLPLPAGTGYVGFLDIENLGFGLYKEYVGACLTEPMIPGKEYTLSFWIGFGRRGITEFAGGYIGPRRSFNMAIFGSSDCQFLPFGIGTPNPYNCPTQYPNWFEMSRLTITGSNRWIKNTLKIRPTVPTTTIALGPACAPTDGNYYYWMDELILEESTRLDSFYFTISGEPCTDTIKLSGLKTSISGITYQWYKDGVAIPGATTLNYTIPRGAVGVYVLRAFDGVDCELSEAYQYELKSDFNVINQTICQGDSFWIQQNAYFTEGTHKVVLKNQFGCDSIIELNLTLNKNVSTNLDTNLCIGQTLNINGNILDSAGVFQFIAKTQNGCDSISTIHLRFIDQYRVYLDTIICNGEVLTIGDSMIRTPGNYQIFLESKSGCDSVIFIELGIADTDFVLLYENLCLGDTLYRGGKKIIAGGVYNYFDLNHDNCDSLTRIVVTEKFKSTKFLDTVICTGQSLQFDGIVFDKDTNFQTNSINQEGCDSAFILHLKVLPEFYQKLDTSICEQNILNFGGRQFSSAGNYIWEINDSNYCKSTFELHLKTSDSIIYSLDTFACEGSSLNFRGNVYTIPGLYKLVFPSTDNCDTLILFNFKYAPIYNTKLDTSICFGSNIELGGQQFSKTGKYVIHKFTSIGCDSVVELNLKVNDAIEIVDSVFSPKCANQADGRIDLQIRGGNPPYTILWNTGDTISDLNQLTAGEYTVSVADKSGCRLTKSFFIPGLECFCFNIESSDFYCGDLDKGGLKIHKISGGKEPVRVFINNKEIVNNLTYVNQLDTGHFVFTAVDANGCQFVKPFKISLLNTEMEDLGIDTFLLTLGDSLNLIFNTSAPGSFIYNWSLEEFKNCKDCKKIILKAVQDNQWVQVIATDQNGCAYLKKFFIKIKNGHWVPNVFSPNGDQINDYFNLYSDSSIDIIQVLRIYDRWGGLLFESKNGKPNSPQGAWFGDAYGQPVNPGVYVYYIQFLDKAGKIIALSGDLSLIR